MHFHVHKRRQAPAVIIVALIDVLIVLLIFLMVTSTFRQQPAIPLALPQTSQAQKPGAGENVPLIVSIDAKGALRVGADARPITFDQLKSELQAQVEKKPDLVVAVSADKNSPLGDFVKVWDIAKEMKVKAVNLSAKEAAKQ
ncbi:MAG TPA: biopolymer transporter ExbD [Verrucomicrobiae bacterium]|jgi:biopolymer transport protein ExbD|nr:biopolymer transporter ExbD [Verrucomicrobiae bacterium]